MSNTKESIIKSPYSYVKTIRFGLEPVLIHDRELTLSTKMNDSYNNKKLLNEFLSCGRDFSRQIKKFLYYNPEDALEGLNFRRQLSVNYRWLREFTRFNFYAEITRKQDIKEYHLRDVGYLKGKFCKWHNDFDELISYLEELINTTETSQNNRSEIAFCLKTFKYRHQLPFIRAFLNAVKNKDEEFLLVALKKKVHSLLGFLKILEREYLPSQNIGLQIAQASLNYYTVNKRYNKFNFTDDFEKEFNVIEHSSIEKIESKGGGYWYKWQINSDKKFEDGKFVGWEKVGIDIKGSEEIACLENQLPDLMILPKNNTRSLPLDKTYGVMKEFRSSIKALFLKAVSEGMSQQELEGQFLFFQFTERKDKGSQEVVTGQEFYENFLSLTHQLYSASDTTEEEKNQQKEIRIARGKYFSENTAIKMGEQLINISRFYFPKYGIFCRTYKKISIQYGRKKASLAAIEKEKFEIQDTRYWSFIVNEGGHQYLWLLPRNCCREAHKYIKQCKSDAEGKCTVNVFYSLTLGDIQKFCFGAEKKGNIFLKKIIEELPAYKDIQSTPNDEEKLLSFYHSVLRSKYVNKVLDLEYFDRYPALKTDSLQDLEKAISKDFYYQHAISFNAEDKKKFIETHQVSIFKIDSYDLQNRDSSHNRHTGVWNDVWNKETSTRINPKIKCFFRHANKQLEQWLQSKEGYDPQKKNRYLMAKYSAAFTIQFNSGEFHPQLAFTKPESILHEINEYNTSFNSNNFSKLWKYGINRGNDECVTLCIAKFNKEGEYQCNDKKYFESSFPNTDTDLKVWKLKPEYYNHQEKLKTEDLQEKKVVDNVSYFIEREDWFTQETVSCLNLSTAKVIKGKIVSNGDVKTYFKIKKVFAKRKLLQLFTEAIINKSTVLKWNYGLEEYPDGVLESSNPKKKKDTKHSIYKFDKEYETILTREEIEKSLTAYLVDIRKSKEQEKFSLHTPITPQINHLRDAITANMVGVISFLQQRYPGIIVLEDVEQNIIAKHYRDNDTNISNKLETALYRKLQTEGLTPPHIKNIVEIRNYVRKVIKPTIFQLGAIFFVDKEHTSENCPYCREKSTLTQKNTSIERRFICNPTEEKSCGFDTQKIIKKCTFLNDINNPDRVAAYNIANKIATLEDIPRLEVPEIKTLLAGTEPRKFNRYDRSYKVKFSSYSFHDKRNRDDRERNPYQDNRKPYQDRNSYQDNRKPYQDRNSYQDNRTPYQDRKPYSKTPYQDRKPYQQDSRNQYQQDNRKPYQEKRPNKFASSRGGGGATIGDMMKYEQKLQNKRRDKKDK